MQYAISGGPGYINHHGQSSRSWSEAKIFESLEELCEFATKHRIDDGHSVICANTRQLQGMIGAIRQILVAQARYEDGEY